MPNSFKLVFFDDPYVSPFLASTIARLNIPVVATSKAMAMELDEPVVYISENEAAEKYLKAENALLYTHSENSLSWIERNIGEAEVVHLIQSCKNKLQFRELIKDLYPGFYFRAATLSEIGQLDYDSLPKSFVIKPAVGFLSLGVHTVANRNDWEKVKSRIIRESESIKHLYPANVLDISTYIIEECIPGDEYAFDCYFDATGEPVILGIYKHLFASEEDVSDRVYITSQEILKEMLPVVESFLWKIGGKMNIKNFPVHVEIRMDKSGFVQPIELNPLRFGGWCTTADMSAMTYEFNPYEYYFEQKKPDWTSIQSKLGSSVFSIVVLDNKTGFDFSMIKTFDYDRLAERFGNILEMRRIDFKKHPLFGFLFLKTSAANMDEIKYILSSDLKEFIRI